MANLNPWLPDLVKWMKEKKPYTHTTLEDTNPGNNIQVKEFIQKLYDEV